MTPSPSSFAPSKPSARRAWVPGLGAALTVCAASACITINPDNNDGDAFVVRDTCPNGSRGCACYGNHTCDSGLACQANLCVAATAGAPSSVGGASSRGTSSTALSNGLGGVVGNASANAGQGSWSPSGGFTATAPTTGSSSQTIASERGGATGATRNEAGGAAVASGDARGGAGVVSVAGAASIAGSRGGANSASATNAGGLGGVSGVTLSGGSSGMTVTRTVGGTSSATTRTGTGGVAMGGTTATSVRNPSCNASTNLIAVAAESETKVWIGGDPASMDDNPCGVQGSIYVYSDTGLDRTRFTADDTVQSPGADTSGSVIDAYSSPCSGGKCCIQGKTMLYPFDTTGKPDYTASVWGGGIGIALNCPGDSGIKYAYQGPATGFAVTLSGTLNGQAVRIRYTQSTDSSMSGPFKEVTKLGTVEVPFKSVTCASWDIPAKCSTVGEHPYDLMIEVVGGDVSGDFALCVDSVTPLGL